MPFFLSPRDLLLRVGPESKHDHLQKIIICEEMSWGLSFMPPTSAFSREAALEFLKPLLLVKTIGHYFKGTFEILPFKVEKPCRSFLLEGFEQPQSTLCRTNTILTLVLFPMTNYKSNLIFHTQCSWGFLSSIIQKDDFTLCLTFVRNFFPGSPSDT